MIAKSYLAYGLPCTDPKLTFQVLSLNAEQTSKRKLNCQTSPEVRELEAPGSCSVKTRYQHH